MRNWDALDHIPLSQSQASLPTNGFPWDAYHVNSIALTGDGAFLVSMRDTWAAYLVDIATRQDRMDPWRQRLELQVRPGAPPSSGSTTCGCGPGSTCQPVRRPLLPAHRRRHLRRHRRDRRGGSCSSSTSRAHAATLAAQYTRSDDFDARVHGRRAAAGKRQRVRRLGIGTVLLRVQPLRSPAVRRRIAGPEPQLPGDAPAMGRPAALTARGRGPPGGRQDHGVRELERRHSSSHPGGSWPVPAPVS